MKDSREPSTGPKTRRLFIRIAIGLVAIAAILGVAFQMLVGSSSDSSKTASGSQIWTCSMHPSVRLPGPGDCPICSMPLIQAASFAKASVSDDASAGQPMLTLSDEARAMAGVETAPVERRKMTKEIRAVGKVQYNESALSTITARVDGYIERLFIDYTGVEVKAGDHLVEIYSPDLVVAQQEMLMSTGSAVLVEATKLKLRRWELTDAQIDEILRTRKPQERITLSSPIDGTVTEKLVVQKSAVKAGDVLYRLANLDSVWVYLDVYEYELSWVRYGQTAEIETEAYPGTVFTGRVWFINPVLTDESRTVKVLVNIANLDKRLKPGMFVSASIHATLLASGELAPTGVEGKWTCLMHPQVLKPASGPCPVCKMALTQIPEGAGPPQPADELVLAVPATAVLDSGLRKIVYVERAPGEYSPVTLKLGARAGDFYPVIAGLKEGDRVVVRGNFLLDSQFQISGLPSLFYEQGLAPAAGHAHGGAPEATAKDPAAKPPAPPDPHAGHEMPMKTEAAKPADHKH